MRLVAAVVSPNPVADTRRCAPCCSASVCVRVCVLTCVCVRACVTDTTEGQGIKEALVNQAKSMIQEKKDEQAAKQAEREAAEEAKRLAAEAAAEEALRWLTHEELRTGNYERYIAAGSRQGEIDEKNKEMMMTDAEFEKVGTATCTSVCVCVYACASLTLSFASCLLVGYMGTPLFRSWA